MDQASHPAPPPAAGDPDRGAPVRRSPGWRWAWGILVVAALLAGADLAMRLAAHRAALAAAPGAVP